MRFGVLLFLYTVKQACFDRRKVQPPS